MTKNYKTKANRVGNTSLAALGLRIIDTVEKSGIDEARSSKQFLVLKEVNNRYQLAIVPGDNKTVQNQIRTLFIERKTEFLDMYDYTEGQTKSPVPEVKNAAEAVFKELNKFGRVYDRVKIADQSVQYIRIIENLKKPELQTSITKISLTEKLAGLDQTQLDYESVYLGKGNNNAASVAPSNLRKEMQNAVKTYVEELKWLTNTYETAEWQALYTNVEQRFNEVNVSLTRKKTGTTADNTNSTSPTTETPVTNPIA
jgi:hypothetical protein